MNNTKQMLNVYYGGRFELIERGVSINHDLCNAYPMFMGDHYCMGGLKVYREFDKPDEVI